MLHATSELKVFKSSNASAPFHLCSSPSPSFLSCSVPALEVFCSPAETIQRTNTASNYFRSLQLQLSDTAVMGTRSPVGQMNTSAGVQREEVRQQRVGAVGHLRKKQRGWPRSAAVSSCFCHPVPSGLDVHPAHRPVGSASHSGCPDLK